MKSAKLIVTSLVMVAVVATSAGAAIAAQPPDLHTHPADSTPTIPASAAHTPYDPFRRSETLPEYPSEPQSPESRLRLQWTKPAGVDLDVTCISRTPMYNRYDVWYTADGKPYLRPGSENDQRWPSFGETVTFVAHFRNKGTVASGPFAFKWLLDGSEVASGTHTGLAPGEEGTATCQWIWSHATDNERLLGQHSLRFTVDPNGTIPETYESNNSLEDRTDALSLVLAVTPTLYDILETPIDPQWPFSAEDWLQKQIAAMNQAFARSVYPSAPNGIVERVRLDKILVTSESPPTDWSEDGGFFLTNDDRSGNGYYDPTTDVSGSLIHELTHQLGIIDLYNLDVPLEVPQVRDKNGQPVQMEFSPNYPGLMSNPGIRPPIYAEHTALALNANKGYRRGYYGEYLYDVPEQVHLKVLNNEGEPAAGVTAKLYQRASSPNVLGSKFGVIDEIPEVAVVTGGTGLAELPNRPVGDSVATHTSHVLVDNPFGVINVVGRNDEFLVELSKGTHQEYLWLDITQFNLAHWRGETLLETTSHVPPDSAPTPPAQLSGALEYGEVRLRWLPSASPNVTAYNLYRTGGPAYTFSRIVTATTALEYDAPYDYSTRAAGYAVTAVDEEGQESGFSDTLWALRLVQPAGVVVNAENERIVLDPQNGYALLLQAPTGLYLDTLGTYDLHLEYSQYLSRDPGGRLVISHPADYYSSRHSVRVTDQDANLLFEFGERGSGPGQFETPSGVALWGEACSFGGPYSVDGHTLLLLHFDSSFDGVEGEQGQALGPSFSPGRFARGALVDASDTLQYATTGNISPSQGALEMWVKPLWDGNDGQHYYLFSMGDSYWNRLEIVKDGANNLKFEIWDGSNGYGTGVNVTDWQSNEWHHLAASWQPNDMRLYVDGDVVGSNTSVSMMTVVPSTMYIGSSYSGSGQANAVIDELRISDIPRIGNSNTCLQRFLVGDSGNGRVQAFDAEGNFVTAFGSPGSGPGQFNDPQGLTEGNNGQVIVADSGNNRLQVLSFDGFTFGFIKDVTADLSGPTAVAVYGGARILVADTGNNQVKILDPDGNLLAEYPGPSDGHTGFFNYPRGLIGDCTGDIVVADTGNRRVVAIADVLPVLADFEASPISGIASLPVAFANTSCGNYSESLWSFGDGVTSTLKSPLHTYTAPGTYTVTLLVSDPNSTDIETKTNYITVWEGYRIYLPAILRQFR